MPLGNRRTTVYLDPDLQKTLRLKAIETSRSVSELVNEAVRESLSEDAEDLAAFDNRVNEPLVSYDEMVKRLKKMAGYSIFFRESVEKDLKNIPKEDVKKILHRISLLSKDSRPMGSEKLTGQERYRIRQGRYRIVYSIQDNELTVWIVAVGHRKNIYR